MSVSVEVVTCILLINAVTKAVFPFTTPVAVDPGNGGEIRVIVKAEPVCTMEFTIIVPPIFDLHFPEKSAGVSDESPPPPQAAREGRRRYWDR